MDTCILLPPVSQISVQVGGLIARGVSAAILSTSTSGSYSGCNQLLSKELHVFWVLESILFEVSDGDIYF